MSYHRQITLEKEYKQQGGALAPGSVGVHMYKSGKRAGEFYMKHKAHHHKVKHRGNYAKGSDAAKMRAAKAVITRRARRSGKATALENALLAL